MSFAGRQINPIDVNFHIQKSLQFFYKNSVDKIWSKKDMEIKVSPLMPIRVKLCQARLRKTYLLWELLLQMWVHWCQEDLPPRWQETNKNQRYWVGRPNWPRREYWRLLLELPVVAAAVAVWAENRVNMYIHNGFIKTDTLYLVVNYIKCIRFNETDFTFKKGSLRAYLRIVLGTWAL